MTEGFRAQLTPDEARTWSGPGSSSQLGPGRDRLSRGERSDWIVVLLAGRSRFSSYTASGIGSRAGGADPGALLGELSALDGEPRSATVTAIERVKCLGSPDGGVRDLFKERGTSRSC